MRFALLSLTLAIGSLVGACDGADGAAKPAKPRSGNTATAKPPSAKPATPSAPAKMAAMDKAKLNDPCLFTTAEIGKAFGFAVQKAVPDLEFWPSNGLAGCTYKGAMDSVRVNFQWHDPAYFAQATAMKRSARPGRKVDVPNDPDHAFLIFDGRLGGAMVYYRQNVEVEIVPLQIDTPENAETERALLSLRRVP